MTVLQMSFAASLVIVAVIGMRALLRRRLPKKTFLALWAVALLRLLLPFSIPSRLNIGNIFSSLRVTLPQALPDFSPLPPTTSAPIAAKMAEIPAVADPLSQLSGAAPLTPSLPPLFWLWLLGTCACALYFLVTHLRCCKLYKTALPVESRFIRVWLQTHPLRRGIRVRQTDIITSPLIYGLWRPVILLPKDLDWQDETKLNYILTHEYIHIKRFDILWKYLLATALAIHWFNPLVWAMYVLANRDLEISCDETVVLIYGEACKTAYARTLIGLVEKRNRLSPLCNSMSKYLIEERIVAIMKIKQASFGGMLAATLVVVLISILFGTSAAPAKPVAPVMPINQDISPLPPATPPSGTPVVEVEKMVSGTEERSWEGYTERMLFFSKGETTVKVTYDSQTWVPCNLMMNEDPWYWWDYEEYIEYADARIREHLADSSVTQEKLDAETARYVQNIKDIRNGIRIAKFKQLFILDPGPQFDNMLPDTIAEVVICYCFGYTFKDPAGNDVDFGLFETRDQLFAALKQYYDQEVAAGRLTQTEADGLYAGITHSVREEDEVPLQEKLINYKTYERAMTWSL